MLNAQRPMSQWKRCDLKCWTLDVGRWTLDVERWALGVEKEPRRLLTPEYKFIGRAEEAPASGGLRAGSQSPFVVALSGMVGDDCYDFASFQIATYSILRNWTSSITRTPSSFALSSLLPVDSPAST